MARGAWQATAWYGRIELDMTEYTHTLQKKFAISNLNKVQEVNSVRDTATKLFLSSALLLLESNFAEYGAVYKYIILQYSRKNLP